MSLNDEDLPQLQQEVQRLLGRCMLRLQQYERLIKVLVAHHKLSVPSHDLEQARAARIDSTARKTLGTLVGEVLGSYFVADKIGPPEDTTTASSETLNGFALQITVQLPASDFARLERELREMVDLRNNLVHHFIEQHDIGSADGCRGAQEALIKAYSGIDQHLAQLQEWAEEMMNLRQAMAETMESQVVKDAVINGIFPDGTVNWFASGIVSALREAFRALAVDGWAQLAEAGEWITTRHPRQLPAKYGCRSWRQVVHTAPDLELRYFLIDGKRSAFYRPQASRTKLR
jgi:hypothetical protein